MRILYLVPHVPNSTKVRSHLQIRGLVEAGHQVTVVTLIRNLADASHVAALRSSGVEVVAEPWALPQAGVSAAIGFMRGLPLQGRLMWSRRLARLVDSILDANPPDIVHVEHLRMAKYGLNLIPRCPVIWDAVDHLGSFFENTGRTSLSLAWRLAGRFEAPRLHAYERWLTGRFPLTLVIGRRDQSLFQRDNPYADRVHIAPPGLPIDPLPEQMTRAANVLVFTGTLDYHPNVTSLLYFVREVMPLIWLARPDTRLQIVGARPTAAIRNLRETRIEVTGFVPSVEEYIRQAAVAIAPILYAGGLQHKVIQAFLTQTPVVASSVAVEGLDVAHERELLVAEAPSDFAAAVLRLLGDPALRVRIGAAGRRYVEQNHDLYSTTRRLVEYYELAQQSFGMERPSP